MSIMNYIMELMFEGKKRETIRDPMYKKIGKDGRVYIDKTLADEEILVIPLRAIPEDKLKWLRVGRSS